MDEYDDITILEQGVAQEPVYDVQKKKRRGAKRRRLIYQVDDEPIEDTDTLISRIAPIATALLKKLDVPSEHSTDLDVIRYCNDVLEYPLASKILEYYGYCITANILLKWMRKRAELMDEMQNHVCYHDTCYPKSISTHMGISRWVYDDLVRAESSGNKELINKNKNAVFVCKHQAVHICTDEYCTATATIRDITGYLTNRCAASSRDSVIYSAFISSKGEGGEDSVAPMSENKSSNYWANAKAESADNNGHCLVAKHCIEPTILKRSRTMLSAKCATEAKRLLLPTASIMANDFSYRELESFISHHISIMRQIIKTGASFDGVEEKSVNVSSMDKTRNRLSVSNKKRARPSSKSTKRISQKKKRTQDPSVPVLEDQSANFLLEHKPKTLKKHVHHHQAHRKNKKERKSSVNRMAMSKRAPKSVSQDAGASLQPPLKYNDLQRDIREKFSSMMKTYTLLCSELELDNNCKATAHHTANLYKSDLPDHLLYMTFICSNPYSSIIENASPAMCMVPSDSGIRSLIRSMSDEQASFYIEAFCVIKILSPGAHRLAIEFESILDLCKEKFRKLKDVIKEHIDRSVAPNTAHMMHLMNVAPAYYGMILDCEPSDAQIMECVNLAYFLWTVCKKSPFVEARGQHILSVPEIVISIIYSFVRGLTISNRTIIPKHPIFGALGWLVPLNRINSYGFSRPNNSGGLRLLNHCITSWLAVRPITDLVYQQAVDF